ncbi:M13 family metallopeptidase [Salinicola rhizosphaerae]|uniref:Zinc metalloprotease n=1 Tax=Salinicola rhizosphaerae TaxID=1443141 RepID=A0ABQ3E0J3_9GAMM|nr:M13 family metallopeptidase [Salinicola rhizosphaerae]GHB19488.1 zinc metalloprotease [Salinicola rhizosphaerae]
MYRFLPHTPLPWLAAATVSALLTASPQASAAEMGAWGVDLDARDTSVDPGDDFYHYVNGHWLATHEIPPDRDNYGAFTALAEQAEQQVHEILVQLDGANTPSDSPQQRLGDLYHAWMDESAVDAEGLQPLEPDLARLAAVDSKAALARFTADSRLGLTGIAQAGIDIDVGAPDQYVAYLSQMPLVLPTRDYYLGDDPRFQNLRAAYVDYIARLLSLAGDAAPQRTARRLLAFETAAAGAEWSPAEQRDRDRTYNPLRADQLDDYAPGFPWQAWLTARGLADQQKLVLAENSAIHELAELYRDTPLSTLKAYTRFRLLDANASYLSSDFSKAHFAFHGQRLSGQPEQKARWKRGVDLINAQLGKAAGKLYVMLHFSPSAKQQMETLVANLEDAYRDRLQNQVSWMTDQTRRRALDKLDAFTAKIAYPDEWETYAGMNIEPDDLYADIGEARHWHWQDDLSKLGGPVDRGEWFMNPQTVNAYYSPSRNEIVFPAAILQPPFFDPNADPAVNYGGIGAVIGHEMSHGFDDQGRKSDGSGLLTDWWTPIDAKRFDALAARLGNQYTSYEPVPGYPLNPRLTMGENIGDLGGLNIALAAYHRSLDGGPAPVIDGVTGDQRFFLAWGQVWRRLMREAAMINRVQSDPHSPSQFRVNGIVRNMDAWYDAFDVEPGDALYLPPDERVVIW